MKNRETETHASHNSFYQQEEFIPLNWINVLKPLLGLGRHIPLGFVGLVAGGFVGFGLALVFRPNVYEATALFEILPSPMRMVLEPLQVAQQAEEEKKEANEEAAKIQAQQTVMPKKARAKETEQKKEEDRRSMVSTYKKILLSPQIRSMTAEKLKRRGIDNSASMAAVEVVDNTSLLEIKARGADPFVAYQTANAWAENVIEFLTNLNSEQFQIGKSFLAQQYRKSKKDSTELETAIIELKQKAKFEIAEANLAAKKELLLSYVKEHEALNADIASLAVSLPALSSFLKEQEQESSLAVYLSGDSKRKINVKLLKRLERTPEQVKDINDYLSRLQDVPKLVNPIYAQGLAQYKENDAKLKSLRPRKEVLDQELVKLTEETSRLQAELDVNKIILASLEKDLEITRKQNGMIFGKVSEAELASAMRFADVRLVSYSAEPTAPVPPQVRKFAARGAAAGCFFGFLASVLFFNFNSGSAARRHPKPLTPREAGGGEPRLPQENGGVVSLKEKEMAQI